MPVRVLSIDGGGIRGVIPAVVLSEIERRTGRSVPDLFDLVAGTSTGGISALGLTAPGEGGAPRWRAADLLELYRHEGGHIFSRSLWQRVRTVDGALGPRYAVRGLEAALERYFGDVRLRDA